MMRLFGPLVFVTFIVAAPSIAADLPKPVTDEDFRSYPKAQVKLGQLLFYDRILSGSFRVSCATCHNHDRASSNGFLLPEVAPREGDTLATNGLDPYSATRPSSRHAPHLFNMGAKQIKALFSDGRVGAKSDGSFFSPSSDPLPQGLNDVLAAQSLFPAVTGDELTGTVESEIKTASHIGNQAVWDALAKRVQKLPDYWPYFQAAYPNMQTQGDIDISSIANAIGAFVGTEWRSTSSPFDRYLAGDGTALSAQQKRGMNLFYGKAECSVCHSGALISDEHYHAIGAWPWRFDADFSAPLADVLKGRISVSGKPEDAFKMRTPTLRNLSYSAPYGWAGGYQSLKGIVRAHVQPNPAYLDKLKEIRQAGSLWPETARSMFQTMLAARSIVTPDYFRTAQPQEADQAIDDLVAFLKSLDDEKGVRGVLGKPKEVPSSLALD